MRNSGFFNRLLLFSTLALSAVTWSSAGAQDATQSSSYWRQLQEADARLSACRVQWQCTFVKKPSTHIIDPEKIVAQSRERLVQQGVDQNILRSAEQASRLMAQQEASGFTQSTAIIFTRNAALTRSDLIQDAPVLNGSRPEGKAYFTDIYDGINAISLEGVNTPNPNRGTLTRRATDVLAHSSRGFGELMFLAAAPVTQYFSPRNASLREGGGQTVILQRRFDGDIVPQIIRATVSQRTWRPLSLDIIYVPENRIRQSYRATDYQQFGGGLWMPTKVMVKYLYGKGFSLGNGRVATDEDAHSFSDHKLLSAAFNQEADLSLLRTAAPPGAIMTDSRFSDRTVTYKIAPDGRIPTDAQVRALIERMEAEEAQAHSQERQQTMKKLAVPAGLLLMVVGVLMLRRQNRAATTQPKMAGAKPKKV